MDNDYFLKHPHTKHLYMLNIEDQITKMKELWNKVVVKP